MTTTPNGVDLARMGDYFLPLMLRNVATDGYVFVDPIVLPEERPGQGDPQTRDVLSKPGCILASPSYHENLPTVKGSYVYNWVRDSAIVVMELAAAGLPALPGGLSNVFDDYVSFAALCQAAAPGELDRAKYTIAGERYDNWPRQNDGPALQTVALLTVFPMLSPDAQQTARTLIAANLDFVVRQYPNRSTNLWEEVYGQSFFTRSVQLKCLKEVRANAVGVTPPPGLDDAATALEKALHDHEQNGIYVSILDATNARDGYDPNSDIVLACLHGAVDCADPVLLATAAALFDTCTDPASGYAINAADAAHDMGPLLGRYPGDYYDGTHISSGEQGATKGHPWAVCTAAHAELYYRLAKRIRDDGHVPDDGRAARFLEQAQTSAADSPEAASSALYRAGDRMLQAIVYHSDHLELSEQFNAVTGYENSVSNLSWSYAAFLSALRARAILPAL